MAAAGDPHGYYDILGISPAASMEEIKAAFRERAKLFHPDSGTLADAERFRSVHEAYATLRDPTAGRYDGATPTGFTLYPTLPRQRRRLFWALGASAAVIVIAAAALVVHWRDTGLGGVAVPQDRAAVAPGSAAGRRPGRPPLFHTAVVFAADHYEADDAVRPQITALRRDLATALSRIPTGAAWGVVVAARSPRAWGADGALVESWETSLLRIGTIIDALVRAGVPAERVGLQFAAGAPLAPQRPASTATAPGTVTIDLVIAPP